MENPPNDSFTLNLDNFPKEVVQNMMAWLDPKDVKNLGLTSKAHYLLIRNFNTQAPVKPAISKVVTSPGNDDNGGQSIVQIDENIANINEQGDSDSKFVPHAVNVVLYRENYESVPTAVGQVFHTVLKIGQFHIDYGQYGIRIILAQADIRIQSGSLVKVDEGICTASGNDLRGLIASLLTLFRGNQYELRNNSCLSFSLCLYNGLAALSRTEFSLNIEIVLNLARTASDSLLAGMVGSFTSSNLSSSPLPDVLHNLDSGEFAILSFSSDWWWVEHNY